MAFGSWKPDPVQADQAGLDHEAADHAEVGLGDRAQPDLGQVG
jgi:hypothetical protein